MIALLEQARASLAPQQREITWPDKRTFAAAVTPIADGGQVAVLNDVARFKDLERAKNEFIPYMTNDKELVLYARTIPCSNCALAQRVLKTHGVAYREIMIDLDAEACARVEAWTGFQSVPTLVAARRGEALPFEEPRPLEPGRPASGVDRGSLITEPDAMGLERWLKTHGFIAEP